VNETATQLAKLDHVDSIYCLLRDCLNQDFPMFSEEAKKSYLDTWNRDALRSQVNSPNKLTLTVWNGDELQGFVVGNAPESGVATIIWLLVKKPYQSQGVGAVLFKRACELYKERGAHKVKLTASVERARDFYVNQGMQEEGFHPEHWWRVDFWVLGKILDD
jgi:GNAT superfamily N-acetyltransferase